MSVVPNSWEGRTVTITTGNANFEGTLVGNTGSGVVVEVATGSVTGTLFFPMASVTWIQLGTDTTVTTGAV